MRRDAAIADREAELEATRTELAATAERVRIEAAAVSARKATAGERERRVELLSGSCRCAQSGRASRSAYRRSGSGPSRPVLPSESLLVSDRETLEQREQALL